MIPDDHQSGPERSMSRPAEPTRPVLEAAGAVGSASLGIGAAAGAVAASVCCVGPIAAPIVVGLLGAGGAAWAASLKPYRGYLLLASAGLLGLAFWMVYRPRRTCNPSDRGAATGARKLVRPILWFAALVWCAALTINLVFVRT